jgi:ABC-type polar amino acid transport system ATPase subunit
MSTVQTTAPSPAVLEAHGIRKSFGTLEVLKGVDVALGRGEVVGLIGPSGSGKSTLIRCLNMLELPTGGEVVFRGRRIGKKVPRPKARRASARCAATSAWCSSTSTSFRTRR